MTNPFENEDAGWFEVSDSQGRKASMLHLATVRYNDQVYFLLGAVREKDDGEEESGLLLVRQAEGSNGDTQLVLSQDEEEISRVIGTLVARMLVDHMGPEDSSSSQSPCGVTHAPGEFCVCCNPEFLQ